MTTRRQVGKVVQELSLYRTGLTLAGTSIVTHPPDNLLRHIAFVPTSSKALFQIRALALPLCRPESFLHLTNGAFVPPPSPGLWNWNAPNLINEIRIAFETAAYPALDRIQSLADYPAFVYQNSLPMPPAAEIEADEKICFFAALGDLGTAWDGCETTRKWIRGATKSMTTGFDPKHKSLRKSDQQFIDSLNFVLKPMEPLLDRQDLPAIARLLHAFEAHTVDNLNIRHLWQPTPFPLETGNGLEMEPPPGPGEADEVIASFAP